MRGAWGFPVFPSMVRPERRLRLVATVATSKLVSVAVATRTDWMQSEMRALWRGVVYEALWGVLRKRGPFYDEEWVSDLGWLRNPSEEPGSFRWACEAGELTPAEVTRILDRGLLTGRAMNQREFERLLRAAA
jgi:hypothetical protein